MIFYQDFDNTVREKLENRILNELLVENQEILHYFPIKDCWYRQWGRRIQHRKENKYEYSGFLARNKNIRCLHLIKVKTIFIVGCFCIRQLPETSRNSSLEERTFIGYFVGNSITGCPHAICVLCSIKESGQSQHSLTQRHLRVKCWKQTLNFYLHHSRMFKNDMNSF